MRIPCQRCGSMILPATSQNTGGLCMPCHNQDKAHAYAEHAEAKRAKSEIEAIVIDTSTEEELFMQNCAVHCMIDCCGFNALDLSESQVRRAVSSIGLGVAQLALRSMRENRAKIGTHTGLIRFRGLFENAQEALEGYEEACDALTRIIEEGEQGGDGDAEEAV